MFTVAVPSNVPVLASEEQQKFAAEHQDVLPQAPPLQPTHVDVHAGLHPGQPPFGLPPIGLPPIGLPPIGLPPFGLPPIGLRGHLDYSHLDYPHLDYPQLDYPQLD